MFGSSERGLAPDPVLAVTGFLVRAVPSALVGRLLASGHLNAGWLALAAVGWIIVAAVVVIGLRRRDSRPNWVLAGVAFSHAAAVYAMPVLLSGFAPPRYALPAAMLVVTAVVAVLEPRAAGSSATALWVFAAGFALVCTLNLRVDNLELTARVGARHCKPPSAMSRADSAPPCESRSRRFRTRDWASHPSVRLRAPLAARSVPVLAVSHRVRRDPSVVVHDHWERASRPAARCQKPYLAR